MKTTTLYSKIFGMSLAAVLLSTVASNAAFVNKSGAAAGASAVDMEMDYDLQGMSEMEAISTLRADIASLDEQIAACEKQRKGWVAATVVGGAGVLGTGIAAIVQGKKVKEGKAELATAKEELKDAKAATAEAQKKLDGINTTNN